MVSVRSDPQAGSEDERAQGHGPPPGLDSAVSRDLHPRKRPRRSRHTPTTWGLQQGHPSHAQSAGLLPSSIQCFSCGEIKGRELFSKTQAMKTCPSCWECSNPRLYRKRLAQQQGRAAPSSRGLYERDEPTGTGDPLPAEEQPVATLSLADAGFDTGRAAVPESTLGGETTCIVCFTRPKDHVAIPCGHQCACAECSAKMEQCPICRQAVLVWMDSSRIRLA